VRVLALICSSLGCSAVLVAVSMAAHAQGIVIKQLLRQSIAAAEVVVHARVAQCFRLRNCASFL
jgi:hypothetical protein